MQSESIIGPIFDFRRIFFSVTELCNSGYKAPGKISDKEDALTRGLDVIAGIRASPALRLL
ncbi:hypothetical protein, partial [Thauera sp.]|uniref:hypothetical protein n=1 Tax=Thauera sp. TaxID=1905334 RepID=UPI002D1FB298